MKLRPERGTGFAGMYLGGLGGGGETAGGCSGFGALYETARRFCVGKTRSPRFDALFAEALLCLTANQ